MFDNVLALGYRLGCQAIILTKEVILCSRKIVRLQLSSL